MTLDIMGWIGGWLLAFCAIPETIATIKREGCNLSWGFLSMWYFGEIFLLIPILYKAPLGFLILNYTANIIFISIMIYYKIVVKDNE